MTILAFDPTRTTNAQAIVDCVTLGYLESIDVVIDVTANTLKFWKLWRPNELITSDLDERYDCDFHWDFRDIPLPDRHAYRVVFDPPYAYRGTSAHPMDDAYGLFGEYLSVADREKLMADGFTECARILGSGGYLFFKCQDQVVSGKKRWQTVMFANLGEHLGLRLVDEIHVNGFRPQPGDRRQRHASSNLSTLQVYRKVSG